MSKGTVYKKGETIRLRFTAPGGERVDKPAHVRNQGEARKLLKTLTALAGLCHIYGVPFDPEDCLADIAAELALARNEVERVFEQIRCPHCRRRIVPEWGPAEPLRTEEKVEDGPGQGLGLSEPLQRSTGPTRPAKAGASGRTPSPLLAPELGPGEEITERIVHDVVRGVTTGLEDEVRTMVAGAIGPRRNRCVHKRCKDYAFAKGLCKAHYYKDYYAKQREKRTGKGG